MAKKRKKKKAAINVGAFLLRAIPFAIVLALSIAVGGFVVYRVGVCPGVAAGGGTALLGGLLWLASKTYAEWPDDLPGNIIARLATQLAMIFVNGFVNFDQCIPQMITIMAGLLVVIASLGGWILIAQVNPELNRNINPSLEMKKKDQALPKPK